MSDPFRAESMATDAKPQQRWQKMGAGYTARDNTSPNPTKPRFGEPTKFLPIAFVLCIIMILWFIYVYCHVCPLMAHHETYTQGWTCLVIFNLVTALLLACYFRCILQHPGTIPDISSTEDGDVVWEYAPLDGREAQLGTPALETTLQEQKERKRLGDRRNCKWCNKYKPDRCHHCRVCRMCILKMDHHCPWIYNCVGFKNFKYFFLLVMYSTMATHIMTWTMWGTVQKVIHDSRSHFLVMFLTLFGNTLAGIMALLLSAFFAFHVHLMARAMTTIEFCEKSRRPNFDNNVYSRGLFGNIQAALGENPLLWLVPICPPSGNGMNFATIRDENDLLLGRDKDIDAYRAPSRGGRIPSFAGTPSRSSRPTRRNEAGTGGPPDDSGSDLAGESSSGSPGNFMVRGGVVRGQ